MRRVSRSRGGKVVSLVASLTRGAATIALGKAGGKAFAFIRMVVLARLLTLEDMGIVAMLMMTVALLESLSQLGAEKLLIQARDGNDTRFQGAVQVVQSVRGAFSALVLLAIAQPTASFLEAPDAWLDFAALALVPLVKGFTHFDAVRQQRDMRFGPLVRVDVATSAVAALAAAPFALWLGDYRAGLACILLKWATYVAGTHLVAERRYIWSLDRDNIRRVMNFGWPLLINGGLMYGIVYGDNLVVAKFFSKEALGVYAVAFGLVMTPRMVFASAISSLMLPVLSRSQHDAEQFVRRYRHVSQSMAALALAVGGPFLFAGGDIVTLVYGEKYAAAGAFVAWIAVSQGIWVMRTAPAIAALALADSRSLMLASLVRFLGVGLAVAAAAAGGTLAHVAAAGAVGESIAVVAVTILLRRRHAIPMSATLLPVLASTLGAFAVFGLGARFAPELSGGGRLVVAVLIGAGGLGAMVLVSPELRRSAFTALKKRRRPAPDPSASPDETLVVE